MRQLCAPTTRARSAAKGCTRLLRLSEPHGILLRARLGLEVRRGHQQRAARGHVAQRLRQPTLRQRAPRAVLEKCLGRRRQRSEARGAVEERKTVRGEAEPLARRVALRAGPGSHGRPGCVRGAQLRRGVQSHAACVAALLRATRAPRLRAARASRAGAPWARTCPRSRAAAARPADRLRRACAREHSARHRAWALRRLAAPPAETHRTG
jgi:hypothetical protein